MLYLCLYLSPSWAMGAAVIGKICPQDMDLLKRMTLMMKSNSDIAVRHVHHSHAAHIYCKSFFIKWCYSRSILLCCSLFISLIPHVRFSLSLCSSHQFLTRLSCNLFFNSTTPPFSLPLSLTLTFILLFFQALPATLCLPVRWPAGVTVTVSIRFNEAWLVRQKNGLTG